MIQVTLISANFLCRPCLAELLTETWVITHGNQQPNPLQPLAAEDHMISGKSFCRLHQSSLVLPKNWTTQIFLSFMLFLWENIPQLGYFKSLIPDHETMQLEFMVEVMLWLTDQIMISFEPWHHTILDDIQTRVATYQLTVSTKKSRSGRAICWGNLIAIATQSNSMWIIMYGETCVNVSIIYV